MSKEFCFKGVVYPSIMAACNSVGINWTSAYNKRREGWSDKQIEDFILNRLKKPYISCKDDQDIIKAVYDNTVENHEGCWIWQGPVNHSGYPGINYNGQRLSKVHRHVYRIINKDLPEGLLVRHRCHNKRCLNPLHLDVGTHKDNAKDAIDNQHSMLYMQDGSDNHQANMSEAQVYEARILFRTENYSTAEIGRMFGVSRKNVANSINGTYYSCYRDIPPYDWRDMDKILFRNQLTRKGYETIKVMLTSGMSLNDVAKELVVPIKTVEKIFKGEHGNYDR